MPCRKQSGVIIRCAAAEPGSFVHRVGYFVTRLSAANCAHLHRARIIRGAYDKARGNSSGTPLGFDCANRAHIYIYIYKRAKVRTEELWRVIFINVDVFFPFVYTTFLRQSWRNAYAFFYLEDVCVCVFGQNILKVDAKTYVKARSAIYMNLVYRELNCIGIMWSKLFSSRKTKVFIQKFDRYS